MKEKGWTMATAESCTGGRVAERMTALPGVSATVDLEKGTASICAEAGVSDEILKQAVTDAGYQVISLS